MTVGREAGQTGPPPSARRSVGPSVRRLALLGTVLGSCARVAAPPGGPPDQAAPRLLETSPDSIGVYPDWSDDVEFRFDEVISEGSSPNFGFGTGDLEKLVILSPTTRVPVVRWRRSRITVHPREGWQPNTVYRVELLPGLADLRSNRSPQGRIVTFSTGAPLPTDTLRGSVVNWETRLTVPRAVVEAVLLPDSLVYRGTTDSTGHFALGPLPRGEYVVYGTVDQNNDVRRQSREPFDSMRLAPGRDTVGELWAFRHDTLAPRVQSVTRHDSLTLAVTFTQSLDPSQAFSPDSVEVITLPDSARVAVETVLPPPVFDSLFGAAVTRVPDTAQARIRADSIRADSVARARREALGLPAETPARPAAGARRAERRELMSRPALFDGLRVRMRVPLTAGARYVVTFRGLRNVSGVTGSPRSGAVSIQVPTPARDTTPPDTTARRRDTTPATIPRPRAPARR